jgi:glycosyltransferase involved in cell wall biosynthesis
VYLSWSIFEASTAQNKIHLDGGISHVILNKRMTTIPDAEPFLMYTGAFVPYSGIHLLTDAMERTSGNFKLVICGNCRDTGMLARFAGNSRFDYRGFVSEEELESLSRRSFAFVNSYLPSAPECRGKFPSKLYEYISFGRPVISTRTLGIAPEYADVLHYIDGEDPAHFAKEFENVFCFDISARAAQIEKNRHFLEQRTWEHQISRFLEFLSQCGIQTLNCRKDTL